MRYLLTIILIFKFFSGITQNLKNTLYFGKTNIMLGYSDGSHPNLSLSKLNTFASLESNVVYKKLSFQLSARLSSEEYISGRSSYFRISFDGYKHRLIKKDELESKLREIDTLIDSKNDSIYALESKIAYWRIKLMDLGYVNEDIHEFDSLNENSLIINDMLTDSISKNIQINRVDTNDVNSDSLNSFLEKVLQLTKLKLFIQNDNDSLNSVKHDLLSKIVELNKNNNLNSTLGIERLDIGMTSISQGKLSNSSIPIQGLRIKGKNHKWFYDLSAGSTVPNRLFSSSVFDQITNNTENIFNLNQFFTVNTSRFISAAVIGYGNREKSFLSIESFYNGREIKQFFSSTPSLVDFSSNISGSTILFNKIFINGSIGKTFSLNDSVGKVKSDDLAYSSEFKYVITKTGTTLFAKYKKIGANYNGFSQGIYNSGFDKRELGLNSKITKKVKLQVTYIQQTFSLNNKIYKGVNTKSGNFDLQCKLAHNVFLFGGYTLLDAQGFDTIKQGLNHLGKGGFTFSNNGKIKKELTGFGAITNVKRIDSNLRIVNIQVLGKLNWKELGLGLQLNYQEFKGLNLIYGSNFILKPELTINKGPFILVGSLSFLKSEQFGFDTGASLKISFSPSENFTWDLIATRWLPTESLYIPFFNTVRYSPNYFDLRLKIALNRFK